MRSVQFRSTHILTNAFVDPEWLSVSHTTGLLLPNELIEITLTVFVDNTVASRLNLGPRNLNCTLIMHNIMGKDHFIAISAQYRKRCKRWIDNLVLINPHFTM